MVTTSSPQQTFVRWLPIPATAIGNSHTIRNKPNQDAIHLNHLDRGRSGIIIAISDGHGGDRYVRSQVGAEIAVKATVKYLKERFAAYWMNAPSARPKVSLADLEGEIPKYLLRLWRLGVQRDLAKSPWTDAEQEHGWKNVPLEEAYTAYGATLLFAAVLPTLILYGQLGDGDILAISGQREVQRPIARHASSFANETLSLCSKDAETNMVLALQRYDVGVPEGKQPPSMILLSTDGYSNSFLDDEGLHQNVVGISDYLKQSDGFNQVKRALPQWLKQCAASGSGDDVTVGLLVPFLDTSQKSV